MKRCLDSSANPGIVFLGAFHRPILPLTNAPQLDRPKYHYVMFCSDGSTTEKPRFES